jgi:iron complex transport system permease protein
VVIIGGGFGGLNAAQALRRAPVEVTLIDRASLEQYRFWVVGSLSGRDLGVVAAIAPFIGVGTLIAFALAGSLNLLSLGEETARALGARVSLIRGVAGLAIMLLAGASVAGVGPVLFVGLVIPHMARAIFGPDHHWLIPGAGLAGAALMLISDTLGRVIASPAEIQVGIVTAAIGGPAFVLVVRRMRELSL